MQIQLDTLLLKLDGPRTSAWLDPDCNRESSGDMQRLRVADCRTFTAFCVSPEDDLERTICGAVSVTYFDLSYTEPILRSVLPYADLQHCAGSEKLDICAELRELQQTLVGAFPDWHHCHESMSNNGLRQATNGLMHLGNLRSRRAAQVGAHDTGYILTNA